MSADYLVTVCAACLTASCWHGEFMCQQSQNAGTVDRPASDLLALGREHPDNYSPAKLETVTGSMRRFPVLMYSGERERWPHCPRSVPWAMLAPHEPQALANHDQTLERLAQRGGLGVTEMLAVIDGKGLMAVGPENDEAVKRLVDLVGDFEAAL